MNYEVLIKQSEGRAGHNGGEKKPNRKQKTTGCALWVFMEGKTEKRSGGGEGG